MASYRFPDSTGGDGSGDMNRCQVIEGLICHGDTLQGFRTGSQVGRYTFYNQHFNHHWAESGPSRLDV